MSYNVPSVYDIATKGSNVPKGKGEARSVYDVLYAPVRVGATKGSGES